MDIIRRAAKEHWQAAAWFLERRYPTRWGKRSSVRIESERNMALLVTAAGEHMSRPAYAELVKALAIVQGENPLEDIDDEDDESDAPH